MTDPLKLAQHIEDTLDLAIKMKSLVTWGFNVKDARTIAAALRLAEAADAHERWSSGEDEDRPGDALRLMRAEIDALAAYRKARGA